MFPPPSPLVQPKLRTWTNTLRRYRTRLTRHFPHLPLNLNNIDLSNSAPQAHTLSGSVLAVSQPELQLGTTFPISTVFSNKGWMYTPQIGWNIESRTAWRALCQPRSQVYGDKGYKVEEMLHSLEVSWRSQDDRESKQRPKKGVVLLERSQASV